MSVRWSNLRICGIPITADPTQDQNGDLDVLDGEMLIINVQVKDGQIIGATGHAERVATDSPEEETT